MSGHDYTLFMKCGHHGCKADATSMFKRAGTTESATPLCDEHLRERLKWVLLDNADSEVTAQRIGDDVFERLTNVTEGVLR
jgi:CO dehydrogenase/acetyl-CoA synthase gamma subunit (corrinoid Fe-S protein)